MSGPVSAELTALAERVESATRADRDLDFRIADLLRVPEPWPTSTLWPPFTRGSKFEKSIPLLTASLDAVLALVAEKLQGDTPTLVILNVALSRLLIDIAAGRVLSVQVTADTIARYALAAFLRALAVQHG